MPSAVAAVVFVIGIAGLFLLDRDRNVRTSSGLWVPVIWVSLAASRPLSYWLGLGSRIEVVEQALDGNPLDRNIYLVLMVAGALVLSRRGREVRTLLRANGPILVFFSYCALSTVWSDYPLVAFKRWTKDLGDLIMVFIVLTERDRFGAMRQLLVRFGFVLVPASVLLVKYYTALGMTYSRGGDVVRYVGVAEDKNFLGLICLIAGVGCVWRLAEAFRADKSWRNARSIIAHVVVLTMAFWLSVRADSMTALAGFVLAAGVVVMLSFPAVSRNRVIVHFVVVPVVLLAFAIVFLDLGGAELKGELGRDATLTERTVLWDNLFGMIEHPLLGTGFESFWLGERLERLWALHWWRPNEAHNGYIEVFLNLGWAGIGLLALLIATGYRNVVRAVHHEPGLGKLRAALFVATIVYGFTEAAFRVLNPLWILFLLATAVVPGTTVPDRATSTRIRHFSLTQLSASPAVNSRQK
jgi:exopolysaccharide production protein ExoQ